MAGRVRVGVEFEYPAADGLPAYRDTLWFDSLEEYQSLSPQKLGALKRVRHAAWKDALLNPPKVDVGDHPTADDLDG